METAARPFGRHAIVVGGGIAGLLSARVLAEFFERVTLLERDEIHEPLGPRRSAPQSHHAHFLLKGGEQIMEKLFPGLLQDLVDLGSVPVSTGLDILVSGLLEQPRRDLGITCHCQTRGLLEHALRRRLDDQCNIETHRGCSVTALLTDTPKHHVLGVKYRGHPAGSENSLGADAVIEAGGRGALTRRWLEDLGLGSPPTMEIGVDLGYATGIFEIPEDPARDWKGLVVVGKPPEDGRGALVLPIEGDHWIVTLGGRFGHHPPKEYKGFIAFTKSLPNPGIHAAIKDAKLVSEIHQYGFPASVWRHYEAMEAFPERLIPLGDTLCSFNPLFGQGMTSAALQVESLRATLLDRIDRSDPLDGLSREVLQKAAPIVAIPWTQAAELDFQYRETRGERPPPDEAAGRYMRHLARLIQEDIGAHRQFHRVQHLLDHPETLREEPICSKVAAHMREHPDG
jgi:2-polyprenyl-6-methoxyphenol hydroxylase-like FAD-dependent oxidoreductase